MDLSALKPAVYAPGPAATVHLDVSRRDAQGAREVELRWRALARQLTAAGAPAALQDRLAEVALEPTGLGGQVARSVVATDAGVVLDDVVPGELPADSAHFGPIAHLMPWVRLHADDSRYAVVHVDHAGADIDCVDGSRLAHTSERSEGGHDVLHKVPGGGWSHLRYQNRVADSWERNGAAVADDLDSMVVRHRLDHVFLFGEPYSRSVLHQHASRRLADRLVDLDQIQGDRSVDEKTRAALARDQFERQRSVIEELHRRQANGDGTVASGFASVVAALRHGAVETLLLLDRPESTLELMAGEQAGQLGRERHEVTDLGAADPFTDRADEILLRGVIASDADLELLATDHDVALRDGIAATLRFATG